MDNPEYHAIIRALWYLIGCCDGLVKPGRGGERGAPGPAGAGKARGHKAAPARALARVPAERQLVDEFLTERRLEAHQEVA